MKLNKLKRPKLNMIDLKKAVDNMLNANPGFYITMSVGQWDNYLEMMYFNLSATLIELDNNENPSAAYKLESNKEVNV